MLLNEIIHGYGKFSTVFTLSTEWVMTGYEYEYESVFFFPLFYNTGAAFNEIISIGGEFIIYLLASQKTKQFKRNEGERKIMQKLIECRLTII